MKELVNLLFQDPTVYKGFPGGPVVKNQSNQCRRHRFNLWVGKIPWQRKWQSTPAFLPGKSHGQRSLVDSMGSQRVGHDWAYMHTYFISVPPK